ncbi:MAG TPA: PilZ domain-containing protein [Nitrospirae bacterium]|nr:PilZ domain-containing protein [Nitrospirota bacterium]
MVHLERRKDAREILVTTVDYDLPDEQREEKKTSSNLAITVNVSRHGLCLYLFKPVKEGQRIKVFSNLLKGNCSTGTVRWVKMISPDLYKVGLFCKA